MYTEKDPWIYFIHREAVAAVAGNWKSWIFPTDSLGCKHVNKEFAVRLVTHHALEPLSTGRQVGKSSKTCVKLATGCQRQGFFFNVKIKFELEMIHMLCTDPIPTFCALRHLQTQTQGPCSKSSVLPQIVYPCFARLKKNKTRYSFNMPKTTAPAVWNWDIQSWKVPNVHLEQLCTPHLLDCPAPQPRLTTLNQDTWIYKTPFFQKDSQSSAESTPLTLHQISWELQLPTFDSGNKFQNQSRATNCLNIELCFNLLKPAPPMGQKGPAGKLPKHQPPAI